MSTLLAYAPDAIFWFAVLGAGFAAIKHLLNPLEAMREFCPVAVRDNKVSAEALWWGGYAFAAMNSGFCSVGLYAGFQKSQVAKAGFLLGTSVLFLGFAVAWLTRGHITGRPNPTKQGMKLVLFTLLFLIGFFIMPN